MRRRIQFAVLSWVVVTLAACGLTPGTSTSTPVPTLTSTSTSTPIPTLTLTPTPVILTLRVMGEKVNCRFGPGLEYELLNELHQDQTTRAVGRNDSFTWWYVRDPGNPGGLCWVSSNVTQINGNTQELPVIQPPITSVTKVDLIVEPIKMVVGCTQFPQTFFFEANITTNGPALVTWKWEASTGASSDIGTIVFNESGTNPINEFYQVSGANDYWIKLHILTPNLVTEQVNFRVECSP